MNARLDATVLLSDWSGVFSDDRLPVYEANMRIIEARGKPRMAFDAWLAASLLGAREFFEAQGLAEDPDTLFGEYGQMLDTLRSEGLMPTPYPDAATFLQNASQRMEIIILSSHPESLLRTEAEEYGFAPYIAEFKGNLRDKTAAIGERKREASQERYAYMGDTVFDIQAARNADVTSIGIATGYHLHPRLVAEQPDILVDSLTELVGLLN